MTTSVPTPLASANSDEHGPLAHAVAARIADLPHPPRLLGFGEPMHGEEEFGLLRNAVFAALVERAGFTSIALESSAWHGRVVDGYVAGAEGPEDEVMTAGFTHGFGASPANRALVRWMREQNRHRTDTPRLRFAGFDAAVEMMAAPSPRPALRLLHGFLRAHVGDEADLPPWDTLDRLLGADEPWEDAAAAMDPARSVGGEPRVRDLRAITDDLRRTLRGEAPRLRPVVDPAVFEDALLAARTAADLLAYHQVMAQDTEHRWDRLATLRDTAMADNLEAIAVHGPTLVFAHNQHLRTGTTGMTLGPMTLRWQPAGAHLADRVGDGYRTIACVLGEAPQHGIPTPPPDTVEGTLQRALPPGNHLLSAAAVPRPTALRTSANPAYFPVDDTLLAEVDEILFVHGVGPRTRPPHPEPGGVLR
ncbi:erythromycin esterase family protein [Pseudonocardia sp. NPDC049154]|uniref:erythromycin esterase family protein n=1 Tax=Pseudonocardia sp. NPDC049154 TaxID=3155501 RepID=UPI00340DB744